MTFFYPLNQFISLIICACVCVGPMSRVRAIRDHHGKDCRFLSFRRGDTISVYHKLTGKREDLWAGSVRLLCRFVCVSLPLLLYSRIY